MKRNNYCKKEPTNRNNCSSNYEKRRAVVPKMSIWELFVPLTKNKSERTFHTLVKRNDYCKKEPINRNICSSNYERERAVVLKMSIWELFVPLTKSKLEQSVPILAENEHFVPTYIKYVPL